MRAAGLFLVFLLLGTRGWAAADEPSIPVRLVADIRPRPYPPADGNPYSLTATRRLLYFGADDGFYGFELWATNGSLEGTRRVADICPGPCPSAPAFLTAANDLLFFLARDPAHGRDLWRSDGTAEGTWQLLDLDEAEAPADPLSSRPGPHYVPPFVSVGRRLFFGVWRPAGRMELWTSDGTSSGTRSLASFEDRYAVLTLLGSVAGQLLFVGADERHGQELWRSDGTPAGTSLLADIEPGPESGLAPSELRSATIRSSGYLYFPARDGRHGKELWRSDGTPRGTRLVRDLVPGPASSYPARLAATPGALYFVVASGRLWRTDGTPSGTVRVATRSSASSNLYPAVAVGGWFLFVDEIAGRGVDLWATDGTPGGSRKLRSWQAPPLGSISLLDFTRIRGSVLFVVAGHRPELWRTDGTAEGTRSVAALSGYPNGMSAFQGGAFFANPAAPGEWERELWRSDGTASGTGLFADLNAGDRSSWPSQLTELDGTLLFAADDGQHGPEPWRSDGTRAGTALVADLSPLPPVGQPPKLMVRVDDRLLFATGERSRDYDIPDGSLWSTGGEPGDARLLREGVGLAHGGWRLGGIALFFAVRQENFEWVLTLWRSDGTTAGTTRVVEIGRQPTQGPQGWSTSPPEVHDACISGGRLHFLVWNTLWQTDGTIAGTSQFAEPCGNGCWTHELVAVGEILYFAAYEVGPDRHLREALWRSDGTPAGTEPARVVLDLPVDEIADRTVGSAVRAFTPAGDRLFFVGDDGTHGPELWVSDGSEPGTELVRDLRAGPAGSAPTWLTAAPGGVFFAGIDEQHGQELWWSDGTPEGTRLLRDTSPGPASSYPQNLVFLDGVLLFAARDAAHGLETWISDGTPGATNLLLDLNPGAGSSAPTAFARSRQLLFLVAGRPRPGYELWAIPAAALALPPRP